MVDIEDKIQELSIKLNSEKENKGKVIEIGNRIEKVYLLIVLYIEENKTFFEKYPVSQDMFIDLCDNIIGIKYCILGGATISTNVLLRRIIETTLNFKIIFEEKSLFESRLNYYEDYLFANNHELGSKMKDSSPKVNKLMQKYENDHKPIKELKKKFRDNGGSGNMKRYNPIFCNEEIKKVSIETLLKKYNLDKVGETDMYGFYCNRSHPTIISRGSILKPWINHIYGSYNISEYERIITYIFGYVYFIVSSTFDIVGCDKKERENYFETIFKNIEF